MVNIFVVIAILKFQRQRKLTGFRELDLLVFLEALIDDAERDVREVGTDEGHRTHLDRGEGRLTHRGRQVAIEGPARDPGAHRHGRTRGQLPGRRDEFGTLRRKGGVSGFPKQAESPHDMFGVGHASTAISARRERERGGSATGSNCGGSAG